MDTPFKLGKLLILDSLGNEFSDAKTKSIAEADPANAKNNVIIGGKIRFLPTPDPCEYYYVNANEDTKQHNMV